MSVINTKHNMYYEDKLLNNYAAEYAKRECDSVRSDMDSHKTTTVLDHPDCSVTTSKLADGAVTEDKLADYSVTAEKVADGLMETIDFAINTAESANLNANTATATANTAKAMATAANETATVAKTVSESALGVVNDLKSKAGNYTTTPTKVGTWMDGTPIWRVVIHHQLTDDELADIQRNNGEFKLDLPVIDDDQTVLINEFLVQGLENMCIVDDMRCICITSNCWVVRDISAAVGKIAYYINGWVEFATPENNISI